MDYQNAKIYAIRSHQTDLIYIGSTCSPLSKRLYEHKRHYKRYLNQRYNFVTSFEILKFEDAYIELLEECPCENKMMLHRREGELIRIHNCVNKFVAGRSREDYYIENKDKIRECQNEYYQQNKDRIREYYQQNRDRIMEIRNTKFNCECGGRCTNYNKSRHFKSQKHQNFINKKIESENEK